MSSTETEAEVWKPSSQRMKQDSFFRTKEDSGGHILNGYFIVKRFK